MKIIKNLINRVLDRSVSMAQLVVLGIAVIATISYALAWNPPSANPPSANADAPLNVGSAGQSKSGGLLLNTGGAPIGLVVQNGNVGIGTASPTQKLHVKGSGAQYIVLEGTGDMDILSRYTNGTYDMYSGLLGASAGPGKWGVYNNGAPRMVIDTAGNVGIGTTSPGQRFEIFSPQGTEAGILIHQTGIRYYDIKIKPNNSSLYFTDRSAGADRIILTPEGRVGIGNMSPSATLDVSGNIRASDGTPIYQCPVFNEGCPGTCGNNLSLSPTCTRGSSSDAFCRAWGGETAACTLVGRMVAP